MNYQEVLTAGTIQRRKVFKGRNYIYEEVRYLKEITGPTKKDFFNSLEIISTHCYE